MLQSPYVVQLLYNLKAVYVVMFFFLPCWFCTVLLFAQYVECWMPNIPVSTVVKQTEQCYELVYRINIGLVWLDANYENSLYISVVPTEESNTEKDRM